MLTPDAAFAILAVGIAGCLWESVQPGRIAPAIAGSGAVAIGAYGLWRNHPTVLGLAWIGVSLLLLTFALSRLYFAVGFAAAIGLSVGFILLFPAAIRISPVLAAPVCAAFSFIVAWLLRSAMLGRLRKRTR